MPSYEATPNNLFWSKFPFRDLPTVVCSRANPDILEDLLLKSSANLLFSETVRGYKCIRFLRDGAPLCLKKNIGPCVVKNSKTAFAHGAAVTDSIASWIKKGFVAGPFCAPPTANFRANSILAIPQPDKVRICINVSLPEGNSLNKNIDKTKLEKAQMSSARLFGFSILEAGLNCNMWKFDFEDAYKNVPVPVNELWYQGFSWLGKYFVELKQMFGTVTSVQNFDILGNTLKSLSQVSCCLPRRWIHRQLDDVPFVCKQNCQWGHVFASKYKNICKDIGIILAPDCATFEKAFSCSKFGKVLGIFFNTETLAWHLPDDKAKKYKDMVFDFITKNIVTLKEMLNLMGCLNHVAQMCPFLLCFRFNLNKILAKLSISGSVGGTYFNRSKTGTFCVV